MIRGNTIRTALIIAVVSLAIAGGGAWLAPRLRALSFVIRAADLQGPVRRLAEWGVPPDRERIDRIHTVREWVSVRVYAPRGHSRHTVLLVSGLHPAGIDEPRLMAFAKELARAGLTVVTPDIPELRRLEITTALTDRITEAARAVADAPDLTSGGRIGLMGISFSGGLSVVAAGRPELRGRLRYVFALGGHDDLVRVLRYLCSGLERGDETVPQAGIPHDYAVAVVLLNVAGDVVPREQVEELREGVRHFLDGSYLEALDPRRAAAEYGAARAIAEHLPEPSRSLLDAINRRDVARAGAALLPYVDAHAAPPALSPAKSPPPDAPVFLLHGRDDAIIPASESLRLANHLRGRVPVHVLLTDAISHADPEQRVTLMDALRLLSFWTAMLD